MKWTAEADLVVGLAVGSGKRKLGVGLGIGRRKIIKNVGIDFGEHHLNRCCVFFLKNSSVLSLNWSLDTRNSILLDRDKAMKRSNVFNLLLQMMPASHHPVAPSSPDHWSFLEEVDAPRWADLVKEAALMGTMGDDAWFHRSHMHHETSLARAENLVTVSGSNGSSIEIPSVREPESTTKRRRAEKGRGAAGGTVAKLIKPALKATVVKACLGGGLHRISREGSNSRGRLSPRPRLSTTLSKSKPVEKVNIIHPSIGLRQQHQKKVGFDTRAAQSEPSSTVGTPKKSSEAKPSGDNVRRSEPLHNNVREAAAQKITGRRGGTPDQRDTAHSAGGENDDISLKGFGFPTSISLYPLPALDKGVYNFSQTVSVAGKSSPSDMYLSSDASPRHSISSQESLIRALSAAATDSARRKILAEGRRSVKGWSNDSFGTPSDSSHSAEITPVHEPRPEISSFIAAEIVADDACATTGGLEWNTQQEPISIVKKRRSLGPSLRVKMIDKVGSSSVKKKSSSRADNRDGGAAAAARAPAEKSTGVPATHPILEKLRKSWGSALRVKQRNDAEAYLSDTRSDTSAENSADFKDGSNATSTRKKWDQSPVQSDVMKRALQVGAATANQPHSETETLIRNIVTRERRAAISQQQQQLQPPQLQLITDAGVLISPTKRAAHSKNGSSDNRKGDRTFDSTNTESKPDSENRTGDKPFYSTNTEGAKPNSAATASNAAKVDLAKIQANHLRSKSDLASKFKKQYVHADTGLSKSMCMQRSNKENVQLEVKVPSPPSGVASKRKPAVPTRKQLSPRHHLATPVNTARSVPPQAPARLPATASATAHANARPNPPSTTQTNPAARSLLTNSRSGLLYASATKTVSLDAADASTSYYKSEIPDRKTQNLAILRANSSTSSVQKLTKQKSEKIYSTTVKEAFTGTKTCKNVADEFVIAAEDRKTKSALKYEPRIHTVRAIREWESKSGKRYYDLTPTERQKVNQEISAAAASKTVETKKS